MPQRLENPGWLPPSGSQLLQSLGVTICLGILGATLYFKGQDAVRNNIRQLALAESTQSLEVVFTLIGSILHLGAAFPTPLQSIGLVLVVGGMALCSLVSRESKIFWNICKSSCAF